MAALFTTFYRIALCNPTNTIEMKTYVYRNKKSPFLYLLTIKELKKANNLSQLSANWAKCDVRSEDLPKYQSENLAPALIE